MCCSFSDTVHSDQFYTNFIWFCCLFSNLLVSFHKTVNIAINFSKNGVNTRYDKYLAAVQKIIFSKITFWIMFYIYEKFYLKSNDGIKQKVCVRSGIRTHALIRGPECSLHRSEENISWVWRLRPLGHPDFIVKRWWN